MIVMLFNLALAPLRDTSTVSMTLYGFFTVMMALCLVRRMLRLREF